MALTLTLTLTPTLTLTLTLTLALTLTLTLTLTRYYHNQLCTFGLGYEFRLRQATLVRVLVGLPTLTLKP